MANIRDISKDTGISITTISRYLSKDTTLSIKDETKNKIDEAISRLGYIYTPKKKNYNFGCIMSLTYTYFDPYFSEILAGIQEYCQENNCVIANIISYEQAQNLTPAMEKKLRSLDGLIVTDAPKKNLDKFLSLNKNLVFIDYYLNNKTVVGFDHYYANKILIKYILESNYKKIAYIGGESHDVSIPNGMRIMVLKEELRKHNLTFDESLIYDCNWDATLCKEAVEDIIKNHTDVDVIFAGSDNLAVATMNKLNQLGIKCPEEIGVVGFNGNDIALQYQPAITTVIIPSKRMGYCGAELLHKQAQTNKQYNTQFLLPVELSIGQSTTKGS